MAPRSGPLASERAGRPPPDLPAALAIAERFLAARPRTRRELTRRLARAGVSEDVMERAMVTLARLGYVDDEAFARHWVEQRDRHAPRGRALLSAELRRLGVAPDAADAAIDRDPSTSGVELGTPGGEEERAVAAAERRLRGRRVGATDTAEIGRLVAYLQRRGFESQTAIAAVRRLVDGGSWEIADDDA